MSDYAANGAVRRIGRSPGWWGVVMLVASEATLFGAFIGTYWYLRFHAPAWPPHGIPDPRVVVPLALVGVLLLSSIPMWLAARAAQRGRLNAVRLFVLAALVLQAGYFAYEVYDFRDQLQAFTPQDTAYGSIYYVLLGAAHAHVFVGLLLDVWLLGKLARGLTPYRVRATQGIAWYWHAVNVLTLIVTATLVSARI